MTIHQSDTMIFGEITSQGQAWREMIPVVIHQEAAIKKLFNNVEEVLFIGCGSGLNASFTASVLFQMSTQKGTRAVPAAEIIYFPGSVLRADHKTAAVIMSRSGKTSEIVQALDFLRKSHIPIIGITCHSHSPLADECDISVVLTPLLEQAVPTTRSVVGMIITVQLIAAFVSGNHSEINRIKQLPELCENLMGQYREQGQRIGNRSDIKRFAFVGNGPYFGLARESQLKIKEMTLQPSDGYPLFDFRHGPQSTVDENMLITVFLSDSARVQEIQFICDMKALGAKIWVICDKSDEIIRQSADYVLELKSHLGEISRLPLYLPAVQLLAFYHAQLLGLNPDSPHNLSYWINLSNQ